MCPGWSETNKLLRPESPERKGIMAENIYTISGLISHVSSEVKQSPSPNLLRLGVTFPDRLLLSTNEQIGVFMDFTACVPETIATSGKAYCKRIMTDVTRDAEKEQFYCVFSLIRFRSNRNPWARKTRISSTSLFGISGRMRCWVNVGPRHSCWRTDSQTDSAKACPLSP